MYIYTHIYAHHAGPPPTSLPLRRGVRGACRAPVSHVIMFLFICFGDENHFTNVLSAMIFYV